MLKACFTFGILNCIVFAITACLLLFIHRDFRGEKAREESIIMITGEGTPPKIRSKLTTFPSLLRTRFKRANQSEHNQSQQSSQQSSRQSSSIQSCNLRLHSAFSVVAKELSTLQYPDPSQELRFNLILATLIVHELVHAIELSQWGHRALSPHCFVRYPCPIEAIRGLRVSSSSVSAVRPDVCETIEEDIGGSLKSERCPCLGTEMTTEVMSKETYRRRSHDSRRPPHIALSPRTQTSYLSLRSLWAFPATASVMRLASSTSPITSCQKANAVILTSASLYTWCSARLHSPA